MIKGIGKTVKVVVLAVIFCFSLPQNLSAEDWKALHKNDQRNAIVASTTASNLEARWLKTTATGVTFEAPLYQDGVFYFTERSSAVWNVYAVDKISGREIWRTSGNGLIVSEIAISDNYLIVPTKSLICLDIHNGNKIWEKPNPISVNYYLSHPFIYNNVVYIWNSYGSNGYMFAYNIGDGTFFWPSGLPYGETGNYPFSLYNGNIVVLTSSYQNYSHISLVDIYGTKVWGSLQIYRNPSGPIVVEGNYGFLSTVSGGISKIDLSTGAILKTYQGYADATPFVARNGIAYFIAISQYQVGAGKSYIFSWAYDSVDDKITLKETYNNFRISTTNHTILYGDELMFSNNIGQVVIYNVASGASKTIDVAPDIGLGEIMLADGVFVVRSADKKTLYGLSDVDSSIKSTPSFEVESPYSCTDCNQYLGQLHSHYKPDISGLGSSAYAVEEKYKNAGYDFVALTEHNELTSNPGVGGILHLQDSEENTQGYFKNHIIGVGIDSLVSIDLTDQDRINGFYNQDGYTILAHPNLFIYKWKLANMLRLKNYNSIEIYNSAIDYSSGFTETIPGTGSYYFSKSFALDDWDELLTRGKKVWGTANDDYTPGNPGFDGGAVMVMASENTQESILDSLKNGQFYSMQGSGAPKLQITVENNTIRVVSDQISEINFIGNEGKVLRKERAVTSSSYQITGSEKYVRAEVYGSSHKKSWTQPVFISDTESAITEWIGKNRIEFLDAKLKTNTSGAISGSVLKNSEYPQELPPMGLYSPIYNIESSGSLIEDADLEIFYSEESIPFSESSLSIFSYDSESNIWTKVSSTTDFINKTISAKLTHFSLYTLSSDISDIVGPVITFQNNQSFTKKGFNTAQLNIGVEDESRIISVSGYLDKKELVFEDTNAENGFSNIMYLSKYSAGKHTLTLIATDYFGNVTENTYTINILSNIRSIIAVDNFIL